MKQNRLELMGEKRREKRPKDRIKKKLFERENYRNEDLGILHQFESIISFESAYLSKIWEKNLSVAVISVAEGWGKAPLIIRLHDSWRFFTLAVTEEECWEEIVKSGYAEFSKVNTHM